MKNRYVLRFSLLILCLLACESYVFSATVGRGSRNTLSLNGTWDIDDSIDGATIPVRYRHTVPVPGLVHSSTPSFADVDQYQSRELLFNLMSQERISKDEYLKLNQRRGISGQARNYFWYHRSFRAPSKRRVALIKIAKAQFGIEVFLNGVSIGNHYPCFSAAVFDASKNIKWNSENELVIRVGAHPGVLPENVSQGTDFEKNRWTPGIYDDVSLITADNPVVSNVQIAPDIAHSRITIQTELKNYASHAISTSIHQNVHERTSSLQNGIVATTKIVLQAEETRKVIQVIRIPKAHLWTPEDPFLYELTTATVGDELHTRFGMREFRFDTVTRRAYLNGRPFFMRGSNITLHRFFEDPDSGVLPWNEKWLHRLLVEIPKELHWNSFRFCIGPVPDRWLEIADENGLLIENEYFVWTGPDHAPLYRADYDTKEMINEYTEWMRDNWNHPSIVIWDATNESILPKFTDEIIPAVRSLDLSNRPWENSYNAPSGPNDPVEDHQYLFHRTDFHLSELEQMVGPLPVNTTSKSGHANILNEYGWLWLNRDGSPTLLTEKLYQLLGKENSTESRFELQDYLLQGETEFWRAYRHYAGVLHFVYLTASEPHAFTADHFESVRDLKLRPGFERAMEQAFNPLGVYLNFWQPTLKAGVKRPFTVCMVNDEDRAREGTLTISIKDENGRTASFQTIKFVLPPLGAQSYEIDMVIPALEGKANIEATAIAVDDRNHPVTSYRHFTVN